MPSCSDLGEGHVDIDVLDQTMIELPGVLEDGMSGRNGQRKPGTTRGSPRRSRTAKASRISRHAAKSRCACGWGGWGRLSDDGARQHNLHPSEDPWGGGPPHLHGGAPSNGRPDTAREYRDVTKCAKGGHKPTTSQRMLGAGLSWMVAGRCRSKCQPSSRIGENPPYGMRGRVEETSASFEARSAPRLYPTAVGTKLPFAAVQNYVRFLGYDGREMLAVRFSQFDARPTFCVTTRECAKDKSGSGLSAQALVCR